MLNYPNIFLGSTSTSSLPKLDENRMIDHVFGDTFIVEVERDQGEHEELKSVVSPMELNQNHNDDHRYTKNSWCEESTSQKTYNVLSESQPLGARKEGLNGPALSETPQSSNAEYMDTGPEREYDISGVRFPIEFINDFQVNTIVNTEQSENSVNMTSRLVERAVPKESRTERPKISLATSVRSGEMSFEEVEVPNQENSVSINDIISFEVVRLLDNVGSIDDLALNIEKSFPVQSAFSDQRFRSTRPVESVGSGNIGGGAAFFHSLSQEDPSNDVSDRKLYPQGGNVGKTFLVEDVIPAGREFKSVFSIENMGVGISEKVSFPEDTLDSAVSYGIKTKRYVSENNADTPGKVYFSHHESEYLPVQDLPIPPRLDGRAKALLSDKLLSPESISETLQWDSSDVERKTAAESLFSKERAFPSEVFDLGSRKDDGELHRDCPLVSSVAVNKKIPIFEDFENLGVAIGYTHKERANFLKDKNAIGSLLVDVSGPVLGNRKGEGGGVALQRKLPLEFDDDSTPDKATHPLQVDTDSDSIQKSSAREFKNSSQDKLAFKNEGRVFEQGEILVADFEYTGLIESSGPSSKDGNITNQTALIYRPTTVQSNVILSNNLYQIAETATRISEGAVELKLYPEELGRVRMFLVSGEAGLTVNILADRPETLELLRRNADELARHLADAGFEGAGFSFGQDHREDESQHSSVAISSGSDEAGEGLIDNSTLVSPDAGLDLRM
ncbi:flagellar hook-length control protein FliK [Sagittula sp. SSi028]|uniref:flagellar hook-length control protein FliK n=1 Tax=Sagittula sp. SSi028 TaxID=3400636 RepID=UPI003AF9FEC1